MADDRRAQQIAAVREADRWRAQDAVMVELLTQLRRLTGGLSEGAQRAIGIAVARVEDQAHAHGLADGYAQAVTNVRDKALFHTWYETSPIPATNPHWNLADYLEAVGPKAAGGDVTSSPRLAGVTVPAELLDDVKPDISDVLRARIGGTG